MSGRLGAASDTSSKIRLRVSPLTRALAGAISTRSPYTSTADSKSVRDFPAADVPTTRAKGSWAAAYWPHGVAGRSLTVRSGSIIGLVGPLLLL
jgi:hypothetical protein